MDGELEYSWSGGQYWSQYNHCRVWENGTYTLKVRDKYGQTATTTYEVTNNHKAIVPSPEIYGDNNIEEGEWVSTSLSVIIQKPQGQYYIDYKIGQNGNWTLGTSLTTSNYIIGLGYDNGIKEVWSRCRDVYGNISLPVSFICGLDKTAPTNLNFIPILSIANEIYTTVSAVESHALPLKYSITYDGGQTWSTPQIGRKFGLVNNPSKGTYTINCRAYNAAGLYVEGTPVQVTIS